MFTPSNEDILIGTPITRNGVNEATVPRYGIIALRLTAPPLPLTSLLCYHPLCKKKLPKFFFSFKNKEDNNLLMWSGRSPLPSKLHRDLSIIVIYLCRRPSACRGTLAVVSSSQLFSRRRHCAALLLVLQKKATASPAVQLIAALCLLSSVALVASAIPTFTVQGRVYCDTCRAGFETNVTEYISGAKVKVECTHFSTGKVEHTDEGVTDFTGTYHINVTDDHEEEICEVVLVESPIANCKEIDDGRDRGQVLLSSNGGISSTIRQANSLGFLRDEALPVCAKLIEELYGYGVQE